MLELRPLGRLFESDTPVLSTDNGGNRIRMDSAKDFAVFYNHREGKATFCDDVGHVEFSRTSVMFVLVNTDPPSATRELIGFCALNIETPSKPTVQLLCVHRRHRGRGYAAYMWRVVERSYATYVLRDKGESSVTFSLEPTFDAEEFAAAASRASGEERDKGEQRRKVIMGLKRGGVAFWRKMGFHVVSATVIPMIGMHVVMHKTLTVVPPIITEIPLDPEPLVKQRYFDESWSPERIIELHTADPDELDDDTLLWVEDEVYDTRDKRTHIDAYRREQRARALKEAVSRIGSPHELASVIQIMHARGRGADEMRYVIDNVELVPVDHLNEKSFAFETSNDLHVDDLRDALHVLRANDLPLPSAKQLGVDGIKSVSPEADAEGMLTTCSDPDLMATIGVDAKRCDDFFSEARHEYMLRAIRQGAARRSHIMDALSDEFEASQDQHTAHALREAIDTPTPPTATSSTAEESESERRASRLLEAYEADLGLDAPSFRRTTSRRRIR